MILNFISYALCAAAGILSDGAVTIDKVAERLASARGGDTIVVADGTYRDQRLVWHAEASAERPIVVRAQTAGGVIVSGASNLRLAGRGLTVEGFYFKEGYSPEGGVVEFRSGNALAFECRVTECTIEDYNPSERQIAYDDVILYGSDNRFDHNTLTGKLNLGLMLGVNLNNNESRPNRHRIDHNLFRDRQVFGSNGAETIRVGTSQQAMSSSQTVIEENLFFRCNGEVEVVSIKSSDNTVSRNLFYECQGVVALRHGDRNKVTDNVFVGNGIRNTGGVRIVNAGHTVSGNSFFSLRGERFFAPLALMNAVPNSLPNRYCLVEDVTVSGNRFYDCSPLEFGTGRDEERTLRPRNIVFADNTIANRSAKESFKAIDLIDGFTFRNNTACLARKTRISGFRNADITVPAVESPVKKNEVGASWYVTSESGGTKEGKMVLCADGAELTAAAAKASAGDTLVLTATEYALTSSVLISVPLVVRAASTALRPVISYAGQKRGSLMVLLDGSSLTVEGIDFRGNLTVGRAGVRHAITTDEAMIHHYSLTLRDCAFYDFGESGCTAVRGAQNTFADKVVIENCTFRDLSGNAVDYGAERDDIGRYNAEELVIRGCRFEHMLGLGINIYRGGSDESTGGPYVTIEDCTFTDVCNRARGSAARLIGIQHLTVSGCTFTDSGRGGASIRLDDTPWEQITVSRCRLVRSGRIIANRKL